MDLPNLKFKLLPICTFRKIILNSFLLLLLLLRAPSLFAQQNTQKPNVLFLFADDQRADALGAAGNPYIQTPNLDKLAREGSRFENAYVMGGNHGAVCAASRAMLLSGKSLFHVYDKLKGENTMPMDFARAGYSTFGTGKWHNEKEAFEASFQQAKNVYLGGMADITIFCCAIMTSKANSVREAIKAIPPRSSPRVL